MISIIIPVYNDKQELLRCLAHIAKQTFRDFEVIAVDDGSEPPLKILDFTPNHSDIMSGGTEQRFQILD